MTTKFLITSESQPITPDDSHPFVIVTRNDQPVDLIALEPFAGEPPPQGSKTAAIFVVPPEVISSEKLYLELLFKARAVLQEVIDAEGVILVDDEEQIYGVLPTNEVLIKGRSLVTKGPDYQQLPGPEPSVSAIVIYTCSVPDCPSPDVTLWQKGQKIKPCPIHNMPRQRKYKEVIKNVD